MTPILPDRDKCHALFDRLSPSRPAAFVVRCACDATPDGQIQGTVVDHMRLFPLRPDVRWTYPVHEQILPALRRAGIPVEWTDIVRKRGLAHAAQRVCLSPAMRPACQRGRFDGPGF